MPTCTRYKTLATQTWISCHAGAYLSTVLYVLQARAQKMLHHTLPAELLGSFFFPKYPLPMRSGLQSTLNVLPWNILILQTQTPQTSPRTQRESFTQLLCNVYPILWLRLCRRVPEVCGIPRHVSLLKILEHSYANPPIWDHTIPHQIVLSRLQPSPIQNLLFQHVWTQSRI